MSIPAVQKLDCVMRALGRRNGDVIPDPPLATTANVLTLEMLPGNGTHLPTFGFRRRPFCPLNCGCGPDHLSTAPKGVL
jgi:hypothetical protein